MSSTFSGPLGGVKNLQVTDLTTSSLRVRWEPAEGDVRTYNIFYVPTAGGAERVVRSLVAARSGLLRTTSDITRERNSWFHAISQMQVSGMSTSTVLRDLQPDTKYTVALVPVYTEVEGKRTSANGKTSKHTHTCLEATHAPSTADFKEKHRRKSADGPV